MVHRQSTFHGEISVHRRHNKYSTIKTSLPPDCNTTQPTHHFHTRDEASTFCLASTLTELQSTAGRRQMAHHSNRLQGPFHTVICDYICRKLRAFGSTVFAFTSYCEVFSHIYLTEYAFGTWSNKLICCRPINIYSDFAESSEAWLMCLLGYDNRWHSYVISLSFIPM